MEVWKEYKLGEVVNILDYKRVPLSSKERSTRQGRYPYYGALNEQDDHDKNRNYWKYLKAKLRKEQSEVVSNTTQLKLTASDGKKYNTDVICQAG